MRYKIPYLFTLSLFLQSAMSNLSVAQDLSLDQAAIAYVQIGLAVSNLDKMQYLYFGPKHLEESADEDSRSLAELKSALGGLQDAVEKLEVPQDDEHILRKTSLVGKLSAMQTRIDIVLGDTPSSFDAETLGLFGVIVPHRSEKHFLGLIAQLDGLIPGEGNLTQRMQAFREQFVIPPEKLLPVMRAASDECRARTRKHIDLPEAEEIDIVITSDKPWVGFTHFLGKSKSNIYINKDVPVHIERAIELGCHEAYPGHHVHASLIEEKLLEKRGWVENSFHVLYGPAAIIAEGAANFGVDLAFTRSERIAFEKQTLIPLAGLDDSNLELYYRFVDLLDELNFARNEAARMYLYGGKTREESILWLMKHGLETRPTASQRLDFIEALRSYVIAYNYGKTIVSDYVERVGGDDIIARWRAFNYVLTNPVSPANLQ